MLFNLTRFSTVVLYLTAIADKVSPDFTVYVQVGLIGGALINP